MASERSAAFRAPEDLGESVSIRDGARRRIAILAALQEPGVPTRHSASLTRELPANVPGIGAEASNWPDWVDFDPDRTAAKDSD